MKWIEPNIPKMEGITIKKANDNDLFSNKTDYDDVSRHAVGKLFDGMKARPETLVSGYKDYNSRNENTGQNKKGTSLRPDNELESSNRFSKVRDNKRTKFKQQEQYEPDDTYDVFEDYAGPSSNRTIPERNFSERVADNNPQRTVSETMRAEGTLRTPKILSDLSQTPTSHSTILRELQEKIQKDRVDSDRRTGTIRPALSPSENKAKPNLSNSGNYNQVAEEMDYDMETFRKSQRDTRSPGTTRTQSNLGSLNKSYQKPKMNSLMTHKKDEGFRLTAAPRSLKIAVISVFVVVLAVLAALIYKINTDNVSLADAQKDLETKTVESADFSQVKLQNEAMAKRLDALELQVAQLKAIVSPEEIEQVVNTDSEEAPGTSAPPTGSGESTYTVVGGDTLSRIAAKLYGKGTPDNIAKIRTANNLTSDSIRVGQVLKIPQ